MKTKTIGYWICTVLLAFFFLSGGFANLFAAKAIAGIQHLGYPSHFVTILAVWKILGAIAIVLPGLPRLKEWAYAGMFFELTGASYAHIVVGDSDAWMGNTGHIIVPLVLTALVMASWALRPDTRRLSIASTRQPAPA